MLGSPGTDHALQLVKQYDVTNLGIHMLLKNWRDTGALVRRKDYQQMFDELSEAEIAELLMIELKEFERLIGHKPTHITSQFGIHGHAKVIRSVIAYARQYNIPVRQPVMTLNGGEFEENLNSLELMRRAGVRTTDKVYAHILGDDYDTLLDQYKRDLEALTDGQTAEIALHPGYADDELRVMTSLADERARDLKLATDPNFKSWIEGRGIDIVSYGEI